MFSRIGLIGTQLSLVNASANDDRSGSMSAAVLDDLDSDKLATITSSSLRDYAGSSALLGYSGRDGLVITNPMSSGGSEMMYVRNDLGSSSGTSYAREASLLNSKSIISRAYSNFSTAGEGFINTASLATDSSISIFNTNNSFAGASHSEFKVPENCFAVKVGGYMTVTANTAAITAFLATVVIRDQAGVLMSPDLEGAERMIGNSHDIPAGSSESIALSSVIFRTNKPIGSIEIQVRSSVVGGTFTIDRKAIDFDFIVTDPRFSDRTSVITITGLNGTDSLGVGASVSLAARLNSNQAGLYVPRLFSGSSSECASVFSELIHKYRQSPVATGRNHAKVAGASTEALMTYEDESSNPQAFGFGSLKKLGKTLFKVVRAGANVGQMMGVPGAELVGEGMDALKSGIEKVQAVHKQFRDRHAEASKEVDAIVEKGRNLIKDMRHGSA
jgi:hypothetical protein